jgi:uncharacterized protein YcaQ
MIPIAQARVLALRGQGLDGSWHLPSGKDGAAKVIERLGYVQIDTIAVVERAHHHTIWSRAPDYAPEMLDELLAKDKKVFEFWTHAASYIPIEHYRFYLPWMTRYAQRQRTRNWLRENEKLAEQVRARIRGEGPLGSADFASTRKRRGWWDWKPAKMALEVLMQTGELMVAERRKFQRLYDLTERVLPPEVETEVPDPEELGRFAVERALRSHGIATVEPVWSYSRDEGVVRKALDEMIERGEVIQTKIEGLDQDYYALAPDLDNLAEPGSRQLHILSPFDNFVYWRRRVRNLFRYDYRLECYLPAPKRRHGYFCLPILWGTDLVGRMDAKADRRRGELIVKSLEFEEGFGCVDQMLGPLSDKLKAFASFNQCATISVQRTVPRAVETSLVERIAEVV